MTDFFTSDTHHDHDRDFIWKARGFASLAEHNEALIANHNAVVGKGDIVYHLGDVMMGQDKFEKIEKLLQRLNGAIFLIRGNHDPHGRDADKDRDVVKRLLGVGFAGVHDEDFYRAPWSFQNGALVWLHHQPILLPDSWPAVRLMDELEGPTIHLCGHVHDDWARKGNVINVGVDVSGLRPLTLQQLWDRDLVPCDYCGGQGKPKCPDCYGSGKKLSERQKALPHRP